MKKFTKIQILILLLASFWGCTTQKHRGDMSALSKVWHNTNAHYNGYFNANELVLAAELMLEDQYEPNYNELLPVFEYLEADDPKVVAENMDKAAEKVGLVVNKHRYSKWTDDCYLMLGRTQYLKRDYETAESTFRYLIKEYNPKKLKKKERKAASSKKGKKYVNKKKKTSSSAKKQRKERQKSAEQKRKEYNKQAKKNKKKKNTSSKKKEDVIEQPSAELKAQQAADKKALEEKIAADKKAAKEAKKDEKGSHEPAFQMGKLYLAKTLIERDKDSQAWRILQELDQSPETYEDVREALAPVMAYYFIENEQYASAIPYLNKAIVVASDKADKARYAFLAGQIHQQEGQGGEALLAFQQALKYSPDYEMQFSSKLKMAQNAYLSGKETADRAIQKLESMLEDSKNADFKDLIYYALADIALKEGRRGDAIDYLSLSLQNSLANKAQKSEAYYQLASLFYENNEYMQAYSYYDSTLQVMTEKDERRTEVKTRHGLLKGIAENLKVLTINDSLLALSKLSDAELKEKALELRKEEIEAQKKALANVSTNITQRGGAGPALPPRKPSNFFAYNEASLKRGKKEFARVWNSRPLEDDWRRSNKSGGSIEDEIVTLDELEANSITDEDIKRLLGNIPKTEADLKKLEFSSQEALFNLGELYREKLKDNRLAIATLEELLDRYPNTNYKLDAYYILYIANEDLPDAAKAKEYYDLIVNNYPSSNYAKILTDPEYVQKMMDANKAEDLEYDQVYVLFKEGKFQQAYDQCEKALKDVGGQSRLKAKYALLMAMSTGSVKGKDEYINALKQVAGVYKGTPEQKRAKELLRVLGVTGANLPGGEDDEGGVGEYKLDEDALHYIIIVFNEEVNLNNHKIEVSNFNRKYYKNDRIRISNVYIGKNNDIPILVLRKFKNKEKAMDYFNSTVQKANEFIDPKIDFSLYPVTQANYRTILKLRSKQAINGYSDFFEENYEE